MTYYENVSKTSNIVPYSMNNPSFGMSATYNQNFQGTSNANKRYSPPKAQTGVKVDKFQSKRNKKEIKTVDYNMYSKVLEEKMRLQQSQDELKDKIKKMEATMKTKSVKDTKKDRDNRDLELETKKAENDKLKMQLSKMRLYMQGLQSDKLALSRLNKTRKNNKSSYNPLQAQKDKNDNLALIAHLREELKHAQEDRRDLVNQLAALKQQPANSTQRLNVSIHQPDPTNYEKAQLQLDTNKKILELTKRNLDEYIEKYQQERDKNMQLQNQLDLINAENDRNKGDKSLLDYYRKREKELEDKISDLCENPFIKTAEERGNIFRQYQEAQRALAEAEKQLREYENINKTLENENRQLKQKYDNVSIEKDKIKEDLIRLQVSTQEKERNEKIFSEQLGLIGQYGEVDSNFGKLINVLKTQAGSNDNWSKINFLDQMKGDQMKDPVFLNKELERIKLEKGILGNELEKTKSLLAIQQEINEDLKTARDIDLKKYNAEIKVLKKKIDELCKLVDIERLPKEYLIKDPNTNKPLLKGTNDLLNELIPANLRDPNSLNDNITEFSKDETEPDFSMNENAVDIYFGECDFEEGAETQIGAPVDNIMSFISVDFFIHETQTSSVVTGKTPMFNLQLTFRVNVDEHFLNYLESDYMNVEVYYLKDNIQAILGVGKIPLVDLVTIENSTKTNSRVINNVCSIYYINDNSLKVASIHYKMRMRSPLSEILKWYYEQNKYIRNVSPVQNVALQESEATITKYKNFGGKVYEIKILITKANGLSVSGPPRRIMPYFYYKFYKENERYSKVSQGNNPEFQDVASFTAIYDVALHDYLEKEMLNVYLFDSSKPIEVDVSNKEQVKFTEDSSSMDLIGICKVPLSGLLVTGLIQGNFPIKNANFKECGELVVNIFWEEIVHESHNNNNMDNTMTNVNMNNTGIMMDGTVRSNAQFLNSTGNGINMNNEQEMIMRSGYGTQRNMNNTVNSQFMGNEQIISSERQ